MRTGQPKAGDVDAATTVAVAGVAYRKTRVAFYKTRTLRNHWIVLKTNVRADADEEESVGVEPPGNDRRLC